MINQLKALWASYKTFPLFLQAVIATATLMLYGGIGMAIFGFVFILLNFFIFMLLFVIYIFLETFRD
jgi:hypothetical protein